LNCHELVAPLYVANHQILSQIGPSWNRDLSSRQVSPAGTAPEIGLIACSPSVVILG
jgi:hypothetical protein